VTWFSPSHCSLSTKSPESLASEPRGLHAEVDIALAAKKSAMAGDAANLVACATRVLGYRILGEDLRGLPILG
jgi:hypothetical protein